ncbi:MAG TPA: hypothetical protein VNQ76_15670 [Planctomicrobium sp.]|nr:hypothetical protein [Planctomicrobium sp.]
MLRALGVIFIVCCCFAAGVLGIGVTLTAVYFGSQYLPGPAIQQAVATAPAEFPAEGMQPSPLPAPPQSLQAIPSGTSQFDPHVTWAADPPPGGQIVQVQNGSAQVTSIEETVSKETYVTPLPPSFDEPIYLQGKTFRINLIKSTPAADYVVKLVSDQSEVAKSQEPQIAVTLNDVGMQRLSVWGPDNKAFSTFTVFVPDNSLTSPEMLGARNGTYADEINLTSATSVDVYDGKLILKGEHPPTTASSRFELFVQENGKYRCDSESRRSFQPTSNTWSYKLSLPVSPDPVNARLVLFAHDGKRIRSSRPLNLRMLQDNLTSQAHPKDLEIWVKETKVTGNVPVISAKSFNLKGTVDLLSVNGNPIGEQLLSETFLLVFIDGNPQPVAFTSLKDSEPTGKPEEHVRTFTVPIPQQLADGIHTIRTALARGFDKTSEKSPEFPINIRIQGPRVVSVVPKNFGTAAGVTQLIVTFNRENPLDEEHANAAGNYAFYPGNGTTLFDMGVTAPLYPATASYDKASNSVALKFTALKPDLYKLVVVGNQQSVALRSGETHSGIKDKFGNLLEVNGILGADYSEVLGSFSSLVSGEISRAEIRGVSDSTGDYVPFPEYAQFRNYPAGFNPSDKVISRIARLYYFRDAHRVVQIVNRKAKSYNRQAVEMDAQLANAAGRQAEAKTDLRRSHELKAIRAAQEARAAEEALQQHQTAVMAARARKNGATTQRDQFQDDIDEINEMIASIPDQETSKELPMLRNRLRVAQKAYSSANLEVESATGEITMEEQRVNTLLAQVQSRRNEEIRATESWEEADRLEQRAHEERFRREVAAKTADPDTYAPGKPISEDPIEQVSLSVIGEGLIQMRGPRKGVNLIHTMINEMDAPVGQVRVSIHSIQINGEHGDRMEKVAMRIQRYVDHARFLTTQSGEMLRKAVAQVASRRAEQCYLECPPGCPQEIRDMKYREAFFGKDFIDELLEMDSEFMHAGNKVLSLHSMDTTSLPSALFLLSLAKNDTRQEILNEFMGMVQGQLPVDEQEYFQASGAEYKFRHQKFQFLAHNAKFVSFRGFFDMQVNSPDTLTPMQREFIRLAQIFKARLVTEIELRQRVMERALIEERIGSNYEKMLTDAVQQEKNAREKLKTAEEQIQKQQTSIAERLIKLHNEVQKSLSIPGTKTVFPRDLLNQLTEMRKGRADTSDMTSIIDNTLENASQDGNKTPSVQKLGKGRYQVQFVFNGETVFLNVTADHVMPSNDTRARGFKFDVSPLSIEYSSQAGVTTESIKESIEREFRNSVSSIMKSIDTLNKFHHDSADRKLINEEDAFVKGMMRTSGKDSLNGMDYDPFNIHNLYVITIVSEELSRIRNNVIKRIDGHLQEANDLMKNFDMNKDVTIVIKEWRRIRGSILSMIADSSLKDAIEKILAPIDSDFNRLISLSVNLGVEKANAETARRPLDQKKFLDMLIDDVEEKYIELIEGTRAQLSNIDNYLGRLSTALEDDFNTQFYHPTFRHIRETSYFHDVQLGQIQTESILTNNRMFAQVSPQATMEFDLPKRNILINEAFDSALAAYNDYGALIGDPNFLALARMYGGQSTASTFASGLPAPPVRDVLPGLPSQTDEQYLSQAKNNTPKIGSNLEALIPDPAIYKFETGTGFSIKPVIQPDGQSVVFHLNYMYTTNVREPVRADEKHLGRVKRHFIDTDVVTGNYELREVSRFQVALKASRTSRGVPLLEDMPGAGWLFRPLPQQESSLQQNLIYAQSVIYPTLFDLMGLRWAPAVVDLNPATLQEREFVARNRERFLRNEVFDYSSLQVDDFMRIPPAERRGDLYRTQESIPDVHPNGYFGKGLNIKRGILQEGYTPIPFEESGASDGNSFEPISPNPTQLAPIQTRPSHREKDKPTSSLFRFRTEKQVSEKQPEKVPAAGSPHPSRQPISLFPEPVIPATPPAEHQRVAPLLLPAPPTGNRETSLRSPSPRSSSDNVIVPASATEHSTEKKRWFSRILSR